MLTEIVLSDDYSRLPPADAGTVPYDLRCCRARGGRGVRDARDRRQR
ncbi:MAG: hypothetical protein R3F59_12890 [Myxococcota bacterium]